MYTNLPVAKPLMKASPLTLLCRFKNHLFDLTFMEKVTRWLTNTQVKVKSEVSN